MQMLVNCELCATLCCRSCHPVTHRNVQAVSTSMKTLHKHYLQCVAHGCVSAKFATCCTKPDQKNEPLLERAYTFSLLCCSSTACLKVSEKVGCQYLPSETQQTAQQGANTEVINTAGQPCSKVPPHKVRSLAMLHNSLPAQHQSTSDLSRSEVQCPRTVTPHEEAAAGRR